MKKRPRALDLFCGDGGASMGLQRAGFDVTGVDIATKKRYPFRFVQADALTYPLEGFDFIWASPPCQAFSRMRFMPDAKEHPNLIPQTREKLVRSGITYCIENVEDSPLGDSGYLIMLCGTMFGLQTSDGSAELWRHRLFETSFSIPLRPQCQHRSAALGVYGGHVRDRCRKVVTVTDTARSLRRAITVTGHTAQTNTITNRVRRTFSISDAQAAMGIDWMTMQGLSQAVPPVYSEFIGRRALNAMCTTGGQ